MGNDKETPEERRERLRQKEFQNPASSVNGSNLADVVGGLGWKGAGIFFLLIIIGMIIYSLFFR
ncbi:hypothetical protein EQV77_18015 [Halobacillus fulvus]|nr:hypothetical protein EQV77_18015 [Halobacillus fulvus]